MLTLTVNQCLFVMTFLVPFVIWLASRPMSDYISLPDEKDKEQSKQQETEYSSRYGAYIQSQGRYYN